MSETFAVACRQCRVYVTAGQRPIGKALPYFYADDAMMQDLMIEHREHALVFTGTESLSADDFTSLDDD